MLNFNAIALADKGSTWTKNEPKGILQFKRNDSVMPCKSTLKAGITAAILPATAPRAPKTHAKPDLRPLMSEAKPPAKIIIRPQIKSDI